MCLHQGNRSFNTSWLCFLNGKISLSTTIDSEFKLAVDRPRRKQFWLAERTYTFVWVLQFSHPQARFRPGKQNTLLIFSSTPTNTLTPHTVINQDASAIIAYPVYQDQIKQFRRATYLLNSLGAHRHTNSKTGTNLEVDAMPRVPARSNDNMGQTQARVSLTTDDENMTELHGSHVEDPRDTLNQIDLGTIVMDERVRAYIQQGISDTEDKWYHYTIRLKNTLNVQHREIQNLKRLDRNPELDATHANAYQASDDCATISKSVLAQLEEDKNELEQVKKDLAGKIEECGQLRSAWQEAAEEVQALSVTDRGFTVDDETVTSKWRSLHYDIRNLTALHFNGRGSTNQLNRSLRDNFKKMCLMYKEFLRHEDMPQYLFQASIWQFLRKNLFKSPLRVFGTPTMDLINDLSEQISE